MTSERKDRSRMHFEASFFREHFDPQKPDAARLLFKRSVRSVEIEVSSFCNRACWFCPNATHPRKEKNYMDERTYSTLLADLQSIDYDGVISFSGYTEATHDPRFVDKVRMARTMVPGSYIFTCSNGDFLTRDYLDALADAGMNQLFVSCYVDDRRPSSFSLDRANAAIRKLQKRLDLELDYSVSDESSICAEAKNTRLRLTVSSRDHSVHANDRGQTVAITQPGRYEPCSWVFSNVYIDFDGTMKPCANVRSDIPAHTNFMYGRIDHSGALFSLYASEVAAKWRRKLIGFGGKDGPCTRCTQGVLADTEENRMITNQLIQLLARDERS